MASKQAQSLQRDGLRRRARSNPATVGQRRSTGTRLEAMLGRERILLPCPEEVRAYLRSHAKLAKLVPLICVEARKEFGDEAELSLKVYRDPEINDRHLTLYVRLPSYHNAILQRLDRVTEPFDEELTQASGFLLVTTDLCPPRAKHDV